MLDLMKNCMEGRRKDTRKEGKIQHSRTRVFQDAQTTELSPVSGQFYTGVLVLY